MFRGAYTALVTPFAEGRVDTDALERLVEDQISAGIDGLVPCGTTGESPSLSLTEHIEVVSTVVKAAKGRVPVLAGAGANCTAKAVELTLAVKELGVAGTLQVTPYYNKPSQAGIIAHITEIANKGGLPIVLYNVPSRTVADVAAQTVAKLAEHELVVGIKEATADMARAARIRELCGPDFDLLTGDDFSLMPFLAVGGDGVISVGSNVIPELFARLCKAANEGRWDEARELHYRHLPLTRALFAEPNPTPAKAALVQLGKIKSEIRSPLLALTAEDPLWAVIREELRNLERLK